MSGRTRVAFRIPRVTTFICTSPCCTTAVGIAFAERAGVSRPLLAGPATSSKQAIRNPWANRLIFIPLLSDLKSNQLSRAQSLCDQRVVSAAPSHSTEHRGEAITLIA